MKTVLSCCLSAIFLLAPAALAFRKPARARLPDFNKFHEQAVARVNAPPRDEVAIARLKTRLPAAEIRLDAVTGSPRWVRASDGFLTGREGKGRGVSDATAGAFAADDPYRATKAFLHEHRGLFGHGPEALEPAKVKREFTT